MKIVYVCGYDGCECSKYKVKLDKDGYVKDQQFNCDQNVCDRCHFMGKPWARLEVVQGKEIVR